MTPNLQPLPFFFRTIDVINKDIITNQAGSFAVLARTDLEKVVAGNSAELAPSLTDELLAKHFLSEPQEYDVRVNIIASRFASFIKNSIVSPSLFIVIPTLRCDHDCRYCQVSRAPLNKKGVDHKVDDIQRIINIISAVASTNIKIEFQGGEPLLAFDYIKTFVAHAQRDLRDKHPIFVICTALGTVNDEILAWAKDNPVTFSVSLDGPELLHNRNRPSRHFNAYQQVVANIRKIQTTLGPEYVSCLATATRDSLQFPRKIVREYFQLGLNSVFIRPLSPFGFAYHTYDRLGYSAEEYANFYQTVLDEVIELNSQRAFTDDMSLIHLKNIFQPGTSGYLDLKSPAGYLLGALVFNYDGKVFGSDEARMLWEATKNPDLVCGTITDGIHTLMTHPQSASLLRDTFLSCTPGCEECAYQPFCGADPLFHLSSQGDHIGDKSISYFCQIQRKIFDHLFYLVYKNTNAKRVFDRWLTQ